MPVDSQHPDYAQKIARWTKNRDAYEGEDAIKARAQTYLRPPGGYDTNEQERYVSRAKWYGATARTVEGLAGAVFQKDPQVEASDQVGLHLSNVTLTGISDSLFASMVFSDVLLVDRFGVLLDFNNGLRRPYWSGFPTESIINWVISYEEGLPKLQMIVFKECVEDIQNQYDVKHEFRYRVCHINPDGVYEVLIFDEIGQAGARMMAQVDSYIPTRRLRPLDFIPFQFFGSHDLTHNVNRGPLDDLVDTNYAYFRHSADYEQALYLTAMPKYVVTGHSLDEGEILPVGSMNAWVFSNPDAKATILEYQGQGLQSHERAMENDKREMATMGGRLLEEQPVTAETLGAVQIRHSGETGSLRKTANLVSEGLTKILRWHHWWNGDTENLDDERFSYTINTDFSTTRLDPQELQALMQLWQGGAISKQTLFWNLKQGEVIPAENEYEDEESMIEVAEPARIPFGEEPEEPDDEDEEGEDEEDVEVPAA